MTTGKEQLEAEIAKRDARIEKLSLSNDELARMLAVIATKLAALKAQQPSAGVVVGALVSALEGIVHDERVPNEVSQDYAALLIEARRLNPRCVQSVPDEFKEIGVIDESDDGVFVDLHDDQSFKLGQKVYAAAPSAKKESE